MAKVSVIGAGSWGTALAVVLEKKRTQCDGMVHSGRRSENAFGKKENMDKLPGVKLAESIVFTTDLEKAVKGMDMIVLAVPSPFIRSTSANMKPYVAKGQLIVNVSKGIEENTLMTLPDIIQEEIPQAEVAVLSGPSHAEEVGIGLPTTVVAGAKRRSTAEYVQSLFMNESFGCTQVRI